MSPEKFDFSPRTMPKEEFLAQAEPLTEEELRQLGIGKQEKKPSIEKVEPLLTTSFHNPETNQDQKIEIDLEYSLSEQIDFYQNQLNLSIDQVLVREIWQENYQEIKSEIEKYGYDQILIIPENLPDAGALNTKLIETMEETVGNKKQKVTATYRSENFKNGGNFTGMKNPSAPEYRIVLTHSDQNIYDNEDANPFLKATLNKNIMALTDLNPTEVAERITNNQAMPTNFKTEINGQIIEVKSDSLSLAEYEILQRMYFESTGNHLDKKGWTWLLDSRSGARVVSASWYPGVRQLIVHADDPADAVGYLGLRLSRSFKKLA